MNERRRLLASKKKELVLYTKRFYPAGTYYWTVPEGCTEVDVFLVGGGAGAADSVAGCGGYTKTFKSDSDGWKDGGAVSVTPGESITIIVGAGGIGTTSNAAIGGNGGYSQFKNSSYRASGAYGGTSSNSGTSNVGGSGGSGSCGWDGKPGSDGSDGTGYAGNGTGQGHTTRDFGESSGKRNAAGGGLTRGSGNTGTGGVSDYSEGSGGNSQGEHDYRYAYGGGGYGGGGAGAGRSVSVGNGGDGTVLIRYYAYEQ